MNKTVTTEYDKTTGPKILFIQEAQSGSISELNATTSTLELNDVSDKTTMFSDRPDRMVSATDTTDFIGNWSLGGPNSFALDPPNAVLVLDDEQQKQESAVIELYNPEYDPKANTLIYDIIAENMTTSSFIDLPPNFGQSTLVIDDEDDPSGNNGNGASSAFGNTGTSGDQSPQMN